MSLSTGFTTTQPQSAHSSGATVPGAIVSSGAPADTIGPNAQSPSPSRTMKILIIEDDADTLAYIKKGLSEEGHTVDEADNGKDGLFMALEGEYDLAVVDRMLPGLDGLSIIQNLRASGKETPDVDPERAG